MSGKFAANALLGKAHAMYANRLTQQNYNDMVNCKSLKDLFSYLKSRTYFSSCLDIAPAQITSKQLEELIRVSLFEKIEILSRYEMVSGKHFYEYYIVNNDISQILSVIRLLLIGKPENYLYVLPAFFQKHTKINLYELAQVRSFSQLINLLRQTDYYTIISKYAQRFSENGIYVRIEEEFKRYLKSTLLKCVRSISGADEKEIESLIRYQFDVNSIVDVYRFVRFEGCDEAFISNCINPDFTNLKDSEIEALKKAENTRDVYSVMTSSLYSGDFSKTEFNYIEDAAEKMIYKRYLHNFRYSSNPTTVMFCYIYLCNIEINNVIKISEGIKYNIPSDKIKAALIGGNGGV